MREDFHRLDRLCTAKLRTSIEQAGARILPCHRRKEWRELPESAGARMPTSYSCCNERRPSTGLVTAHTISIPRCGAVDRASRSPTTITLPLLRRAALVHRNCNGRALFQRRCREKNSSAGPTCFRTSTHHAYFIK